MNYRANGGNNTVIAQNVPNNVTVGSDNGSVHIRVQQSPPPKLQTTPMPNNVHLVDTTATEPVCMAHADHPNTTFVVPAPSQYLRVGGGKDGTLTIILPPENPNGNGNIILSPDAHENSYAATAVFKNLSSSTGSNSPSFLNNIIPQDKQERVLIDGPFEGMRITRYVASVYNGEEVIYVVSFPNGANPPTDADKLAKIMDYVAANWTTLKSPEDITKTEQENTGAPLLVPDRAANFGTYDVEVLHSSYDGAPPLKITLHDGAVLNASELYANTRIDNPARYIITVKDGAKATVMVDAAQVPYKFMDITLDAEDGGDINLVTLNNDQVGTLVDGDHQLSQQPLRDPAGTEFTTTNRQVASDGSHPITGRVTIIH